MAKTKSIKQDFSTENPALHALYTQWAIKHILIIDRTIKDFNDQGNGVYLNFQLFMYKERARLIKEDAAFEAALAILNDLAKNRLINKVGDLFIGFNLALEEL
jgi:hypothetical protein